MDTTTPHDDRPLPAQQAGSTADGREVAYPWCCGQMTSLRVFGWYCARCGTAHDFVALREALAREDTTHGN